MVVFNLGLVIKVLAFNIEQAAAGSNYGTTSPLPPGTPDLGGRLGQSQLRGCQSQPRTYRVFLE